MIVKELKIGDRAWFIFKDDDTKRWSYYDREITDIKKMMIR